jgi:hypothetical protein
MIVQLIRLQLGTGNWELGAGNGERFLSEAQAEPKTQGAGIAVEDKLAVICR